MTLDAGLTVSALLVVALLSGLAVFSTMFEDTLMQRLALTGMAIGSLSLAWAVWRAGEAAHVLTWYALANALFCAETARKLVRKLKKGRWRFERSD